MVKSNSFTMARSSGSSMDDAFDTSEDRRSGDRNVIVISLEAQRPHTRPTKDDGLRSEEPTTTPRSSTAEPCGRSSSTCRRPTDSPFSCRRWRRLTGKVPEPEEEIKPVVRLAHPPPHWSSSMQTKGFVSAFPSAPCSVAQPPVSPRSKSGDKRLQWKDIDRFEPRVMKKLVDKAYGINARHHVEQQFPLQHGNREARRQFIRSQVYLPSVNRTLDYLQKAREVLPTVETPRSSPPRPVRPAPARLGAKLLSSQLQDLQAELLVHYEAERAEAAVSGSLGLQHDGRLWSPQPPPHPSASFLSSSTSSSSLVRSRSNSGSFRSLRHTHSKPSRDSASDSNEDDTATEEEAMMLTDSDTYSLSSGVEADSETESPPDAAASESSDTASWCSLASHVILALEGTDAAQVGSVREPLVMSYDSDDVALFAASTSSSSRGASVSSGSTASLPECEGSDDEHVVFVDNGVRVNSSGQAVEENDLAFALAMLMQDIDHEQGAVSDVESADTISEEERREDSEVEDLQQHQTDVESSDDSEREEMPIQDEPGPSDTVTIETPVAEEEQHEDIPVHVAESPVMETTTEPTHDVEEPAVSVENHETYSEADADGSSGPQDTRHPASEPTEASSEEPAPSHSSSRPRLSITSESHYDDGDFEELEMNDAESDQGYESFED